MIFGIVMGICALIMFGIGVFQITRKEPIAFYTGEKAPDKTMVRSVKTWNKRHGFMWLIYGGVIIVGIIVGVIVNSTVIFTVIECVCLLVPLPLMALYHKKLVSDYIISQ